MRQRDIIYLKENEFCITGAAIWMSEWELAELFYATQGEIRAAINRMLKDGAIPACHSTRYMLYVVKRKCTTANIVIYSDTSFFYYQKFFC